MSLDCLLSRLWNISLDVVVCWVWCRDFIIRLLVLVRDLQRGSRSIMFDGVLG